MKKEYDQSQITLYRYSDFESDSDEDSEISFFKSSSSVERYGEAALKFKL